jgi:hypothetical protein
MAKCARGGLKAPHIVQEAANEVVILGPGSMQGWRRIRQQRFARATSFRRGADAGNRFGCTAAFRAGVAKG